LKDESEKKSKLTLERETEERPSLEKNIVIEKSLGAEPVSHNTVFKRKWPIEDLNTEKR